MDLLHCNFLNERYFPFLSHQTIDHKRFLRAKYPVAKHKIYITPNAQSIFVVKCIKLPTFNDSHNLGIESVLNL